MTFLPSKKVFREGERKLNCAPFWMSEGCKDEMMIIGRKKFFIYHWDHHASDLNYYNNKLRRGKRNS